MIEFVNGVIYCIYKDYVVISCNNIGYKIFMSQCSLEKLNCNENAFIYTYMNVKENLMELYGFNTFKELQYFKLLLNVTGIGCKVALKITNNISSEELSVLISNNDLQLLKKVQGVGNKMAQNMILELNGKIQKLFPTTDEAVEKINNILTVDDERIIDECKLALTSLGFTATESRQISKRIYKKGMTIQDMMKVALFELSVEN